MSKDYAGLLEDLASWQALAEANQVMLREAAAELRRLQEAWFREWARAERAEHLANVAAEQKAQYVSKGWQLQTWYCHQCGSPFERVGRTAKPIEQPMLHRCCTCKVDVWLPEWQLVPVRVG